MATGKITKDTVDAAQAGDRDSFLWDDKLKGFGLKVTPKNVRTYVIQYRMGGRESPVRRYTIGQHGSPWTPAAARKRAEELMIMVATGVDPMTTELEERRSNVELAFRAYVDLFVDRYAKREQRRSWQQAAQVLKNHAVPAFANRSIAKISRREIANLLETVASAHPATARYLHAVLRKLFRWAVSRGDIEHSPMVEMRAPAPALVRDRVLTDGEIRQIWISAGTLGFPFAPMFRLLMATGQRREEIAGMAWSELNLATGEWLLPAARAKNGVAHFVPLNALALEELKLLTELRRGDCDLLFSTTGRSPPSGWSKAKARLDDLLPVMSAWRTHDIRRTLATGLQRLGVRFEVTEAILNHVSGSRSGVAGIYQRHDWADEKRAAIRAWGAGLQYVVQREGNRLTEATSGKIVDIKSKQAAEG